MALSSTLTDRQLEVLRWIAEGCPPHSWPDHSYKTTALALQNRRLVTVSKRNGWNAAVEPAGQYYLDHGFYPDGHFRTPKRRSRAQRTPADAPDLATPSRPPTARLTVSPRELVDQLLADGPIEITVPTADERAAWRRTIHAALGSGLIPEGKFLRHSGRDRGPLVIRLDDQPRLAPARHPVRVPAEYDPQDPVIQRLVAEPSRLGVSSSALPRALCIVQALVAETRRRGYQLDIHPDTACGFLLERFGYTQSYVMVEEDDQIEEFPDDEVSAKKYSWERVSARIVTVPSGRLVLRYDQTWHVRRWADRKRWRLDDKLPELLDDFEQQAQEHLDRRLAREAEEQRLENVWVLSRRQAHRLFALEHNRSRALSHIDNLDRAQRLRDYAGHLDALLEECSDPATASEIRGWQLFISAEAERTDPLRHTERLRWVEPEAADHDLEPFMPSGMHAAYPPSPGPRSR